MNKYLIGILVAVTLISCNRKLNKDKTSSTSDTSPTLKYTPETWLQQNTIELDKDGAYNFTELGKIIGDKRIVAIGESSHGLGKFYELKAELVKYLHQEMDFEVLAMEGGVGDINLAYSNIDTLDAQQLRDNTVFANFRAKEVDLLFAHIKETSTTENPLLFTGYDTQSSSKYVTKMLQRIVKPYDRQLSDSLQIRFGSYFKAIQAGNSSDSVGYVKHRDIFIKTSADTEAILIDNRVQIKKEIQLSDFQMNCLTRMMKMFQESMNLAFSNRYYGIELRDKLMAENIKWLIETVYPNKKIIIWAHNVHIENSGIEGSLMTWMGHYLKKQYKSDYYALGLFAYKGNTYQHWTKEIIPFENSDSTFLEKKMIDTGKSVTFLDLDPINNTQNTGWLFHPIQAYEVEIDGVISFIPKKRFDGIITVFKSDAPTYEK